METVLKYKTGDAHPIEKYLAFVEYCDQGHAVWTSVFGDPDAPYRLVTKSEQHPPLCRCRLTRTQDSAAFAPREEGETEPQLSPGVPLGRN